MVSEPLRGFVAFPTAALEGLPHSDLCPVSVLSVVLYTIHVLQQENHRVRNNQEVNSNFVHADVRKVQHFLYQMYIIYKTLLCNNGSKFLLLTASRIFSRASQHM